MSAADMAAAAIAARGVQVVFKQPNRADVATHGVVSQSSERVSLNGGDVVSERTTLTISRAAANGLEAGARAEFDGQVRKVADVRPNLVGATVTLQ